MAHFAIDFFHSYFNTELIIDGQSAIPILKNMGPEKFFDFAETTLNFFRDEISSPDTEFTFLADSKLSGMPLYCSAAKCRQDYLSQLAMFALLYTDKTYVINPFAYAVFRTNEDDIEQLIREFSIAIFSAIFLSPLLEKGIIKFTDPDAANICEGCIDKVFSKRTLPSSVPDMAFDFLYETSKLEVKKIHGEKVVVINYDDIHDEHTLICMLENSKVVKIGENITKQKARALKIFGNPTENLSYDFYVRNIHAHKQGTHNLMCSPAEFSIVNSVTGHQFVNSGFEVKYPLLSSRRMRQALKVRENEWHHLNKFRKTIREIKNDKSVNPNKLTQITNDEFGAIKLVLEKADRQAKGMFLEAGIFSCIGIVGAIGTAGIAPLLSGAAAIIGNGCSAQKITEAMKLKISAPDEALDANFYYAWKMSKVLRD